MGGSGSWAVPGLPAPAPRLVRRLRPWPVVRSLARALVGELLPDDPDLVWEPVPSRRPPVPLWRRPRAAGLKPVRSRVRRWGVFRLPAMPLPFRLALAGR
jgi:hypothetical protein